MDVAIQDQLFIIGGATSGLGKAIAEALVAEGARIIAVARGAEPLQALQATAPAQIEIVNGNITESSTIQQLVTVVGNRQLQGIVVNAGGPPAKTVMETTLEDWDNAYQTLLRWKVEITQAFVPGMIAAGYGRILYLESSSVKQPLENLVLSNSLRVAVVNMAKTLSLEIAQHGVTINILAPGSHDTNAVERLYKKKSEQTGASVEDVRKQAIQQIPVKKLGDPANFASLAVWLLSPAASYITGQTISVDGGVVRGIFG